MSDVFALGPIGGGMCAPAYGGDEDGLAEMFGSTRSAGASLFERVRGSGAGPLTDEGLFLLMYQMLQAQNQQLRAKVDQFEAATGLQKKYAEYRRLMGEAQARAVENGSEEYVLTEQQLRDMGFKSSEVAAIRDRWGDEITPGEFAEVLNTRLFGDDDRLYVTVSCETFEHSAFQESVLPQLDRAQEANCADTTLMTTELSSLVQEQQRLTSMFSNTLSKLHESSMSVIRNI